ncbi:hypothetical protein H4R19_005073 [Coemansia spiralis]|nr:hypothetical protein H4R19_005073 [Coemansia spiralis]
MRRQPPYDTECSWPGLEPGLPAPHTNTAADAYNALGVLSVHTPTEQQLDQAHAPSVLGRLRELEGAIALVKSSLDNHASSYYSVASQIAE